MIRDWNSLPRIDAGILNQEWFASLPAKEQVAFFKLWLRSDEIGVAENRTYPIEMLKPLFMKDLVLMAGEGNFILLCDYIHVQVYEATRIPSLIRTFVECPFQDFKTYLMERYDGIFTEERLDKYNRGVLVRSLGVPFSEWKKLRAQVFVRDKHICRYCGKYVEDPHCDHVIPLCKGGKTVQDNLVTACPACNLSKHDKTPEEWRKG